MSKKTDTHSKTELDHQPGNAPAPVSTLAKEAPKEDGDAKVKDELVDVGAELAKAKDDPKAKADAEAKAKAEDEAAKAKAKEQTPPELLKKRNVPTVEEVIKDGAPPEIAPGIVAREQALFDGKTQVEADVAAAKAIAAKAKPKTDDPVLPSAPPVYQGPPNTAPGSFKAPRPGPRIEHAKAGDRFDKKASSPQAEDAEVIFTAFDGATVGARPNPVGNIAMRALGPINAIQRGEVFGEKPPLAYRLVKLGFSELLDLDSLKLVSPPQ